MDIFVSNVPEQFSEKQVEKFFKQYIHDVGCRAFHVRKMKNKPTAFLTLASEKAARDFLNRHNGSHNRPLSLGGKVLICKEAHRKPDPLLLNALQKEEDESKKLPKKPANNSNSNNDNDNKTAPPKLVTNFRFTKLYCGIWETKFDSLFFQKYYEDARFGTFTLNRGGLNVVLDGLGAYPSHILFDIFFHCIETIAIGDPSDPHVTFTLSEPPKIAQLDTDPQAELEQRLAHLSVTGTFPEPETTYSRVGSLHSKHDVVSGCCLVYKLILQDQTQLRELARTLKEIPGSPAFVPRWTCRMGNPQFNFRELLRRMERDLQTNNRAAAVDTPAFSMPFALQFQFMRLAYNCLLNPTKIRKIIFPVQLLMERYSIIAVSQAVRKISLQLPIPGPDTVPGTLGTRKLIKDIEAIAAEFRFSGSVYDTALRHDHLGMIYRVNITPTGMLLEGPELETKNRVLRKYDEHADYFLRVTFSDEDCEAMRHHRTISPKRIYQERFRSILTKGINICGRNFRFLGFSNSSLHTHQCWFMAPFIQADLTFIHAPLVIKGLGDFTVFRSPARCAARIGQTFSDATDTITIDESNFCAIKDIERADASGVTRNFSDGVGTISRDLLRDVWKEFRKARREHATLLQIRFQGAKGMLSLDTRLNGKMMCLRPSMVKFEGSPSFELEICGAGFRHLPLFLNRQFIKILEDLGVPQESFLNLQNRAVDNIREVMHAPLNAARFLETNFVSVTAQIPQLIRALATMGYNFRDDEFLANVVEMAAFYRLREIKYRGRIPVENGYTLYGVVDETEFLQEGQIYAAIRHENGSLEVLTGSLLITRAPALHPGDVQLVEAVNVPDWSALKNLHNCVAFSQMGDRDLPSMLSGGDLDGDIFQLIFEPSLWPKGTFTAADYEKVTPVDIGREVKEGDIIDFFLAYMESDQLGRIANTHLIVADQKPNGTLSPECLALAELHSTAVDFAKTGIAVDLSKFPKNYNKKLKPDFMATAPRMLIGKSNLSFEESEDVDQDHGLEEFGIRLNLPARYYRSDKILGALYRAIDEEKIHAELRSAHVPTVSSAKQDELITNVYNFVVSKTVNIDWGRRCREARDIRSRYNENLVETAFQYSSDTRVPLAELEVFTGIILGKNAGMLSKRTRNRNIDMKEKFDRDMAFIIGWILHGDRTTEETSAAEEEGGESDYASLERGVACFAVAMEEPADPVGKFGTPQSFRYVAAGICLKELRRLEKGR